MPEVKVLTRNLYLGASIAPIMAVSSPVHLPRAVAEVWSRISDSLYPERAAAMAAEVAVQSPHLIGLQEVWDFSVRPIGAGPGVAPVARVDYLEILRQELARLGLEYVVACATPGPEFTVPSATGHAIHAQDRDVILCRSDVEVVASDGARYLQGATIHLGGKSGGRVPSSRAWARARVVVEGRPLTFVSTHLETPDFPDVQVAQTREFLDLVRQAPRDLVAVGDFNSGPGDRHLAPYELLIGAGLTDAWAAARPGEAGATCGQAEDLRNPQSQLSARIDLVLTWSGHGQQQPPCRHILRVGDGPACRTPSGLWPSDHAGVVAVLDLAGRDGAAPAAFPPQRSLS